MAKIVLREYSWFDAGKEVKDRCSFAYITYKARQKLKQKLVKLSKRNLSRGALEKALCGIKAPNKEGLYLREDRIYTCMYGPLGEAFIRSRFWMPREIYLGYISE